MIVLKTPKKETKCKLNYFFLFPIPAHQSCVRAVFFLFFFYLPENVWMRHSVHELDLPEHVGSVTGQDVHLQSHHLPWDTVLHLEGEKEKSEIVSKVHFWHNRWRKGFGGNYATQQWERKTRNKNKRKKRTLVPLLINTDDTMNNILNVFKALTLEIILVLSLNLDFSFLLFWVSTFPHVVTVHSCVFVWRVKNVSLTVLYCDILWYWLFFFWPWSITGSAQFCLTVWLLPCCHLFLWQCCRLV